MYFGVMVEIYFILVHHYLSNFRPPREEPLNISLLLV